MASGIEGRDVARNRRDPPLRRGLDAVAGARPATLLFAAAAAASAALMLLLGSRLTFLADDWTFLLDRRGLNAAAILEPYAEQIVIGPVLVYKALLATVGMDSAVPYRLVSVAAFIASVAVLFVYLRRRVGDWPALAGAVVVLFLGAAWEVLLWPFQLGYPISMGTGLGALLALERRDRDGDLIAGALLTVSVLFSGLGLAFLAGAAVAIAIGARGRRPRWPVVAIPAGLYALWWIGWGHEAWSEVSLENIATAPLFLADGLASAISSLLGLATPRDETTIGALDWGRPLLVAALAVAGWILWRRRAVSASLIVIAVVAAVFWLLAGSNEAPDRGPLLSRYQYVGAILVLVIAAELVRGGRLSRWGLAAVFAVTALAVASNLSYLHQSYRASRATSEIVRADLAALELARGSVVDEFGLTGPFLDTSYPGIDSDRYFSAVDDFGSPAYSEAELAAASEPVRQAADAVLANALGLAVAPAPEPPDDACLEVPVTGARVVDLPVGGAVIVAPSEAAVSLRLHRFAGLFPIRSGELEPGDARSIEIPPDGSSRPWQLEIQGTGRTRVCEAGAG